MDVLGEADRRRSGKLIWNSYALCLHTPARTENPKAVYTESGPFLKVPGKFALFYQGSESGSVEGAAVAGRAPAGDGRVCLVSVAVEFRDIAHAQSEGCWVMVRYEDGLGSLLRRRGPQG